MLFCRTVPISDAFTRAKFYLNLYDLMRCFLHFSVTRVESVFEYANINSQTDHGGLLVQMNLRDKSRYKKICEEDFRTV